MVMIFVPKKEIKKIINILFCETVRYSFIHFVIPLSNFFWVAIRIFSHLYKSEIGNTNYDWIEYPKALTRYHRDVFKIHLWDSAVIFEVFSGVAYDIPFMRDYP